MNFIFLKPTDYFVPFNKGDKINDRINHSNIRSYSNIAKSILQT